MSLKIIFVPNLKFSTYLNEALSKKLKLELSLLIFALNNAINWKMGIFLAIGTIFGAWFASRWSVKKGDRVIRYAMIITISIMAIKLWFFE